MIDRAFDLNQVLYRRIMNLIGNRADEGLQPLKRERDIEIVSAPGASQNPDTPIDVVITANEISYKHGTGPLVMRLFPGGRNIFSIRTKSDWGEQEFGDWSAVISQKDQPRAEWFRNVLSVLGGRNIHSVLCVPYLDDELKTSIAVQASFNAPLCVYIMDDQNIGSNKVPDDLMREFLERSSLRLATHPELRYVYEQKYGQKFYILPAIVPDRLVLTQTSMPSSEFLDTKRGAIIGSFWDQTWFDRTCEVLAECDSKIDWYGNNKSPWLRFPQEALDGAGIKPMGLVSEADLAEKLREYPFVIVPVGTLDEEDSDTGVARLSLPGRILFALASSHTPVLVIGSEKTCGARIVKHFEVGEVVPYSAVKVAEAIRRLTDIENQKRLRANAAKIAQSFSDRGISKWLQDSIERGEPADNRFEEIFEGYDASVISDYLPADNIRAGKVA